MSIEEILEVTHKFIESQPEPGSDFIDIGESIGNKSPIVLGEVGVKPN
jgi:hypothetical protein